MFSDSAKIGASRAYFEEFVFGKKVEGEGRGPRTLPAEISGRGVLDV